MLVKTLISELTVQAFDKCILSGLTWLDKTKSDAIFFAPEEHRFAGKFRPVVTSN